MPDERRFREVVASARPAPEEVLVVAPITESDVQAFREGSLRYSWQTEDDE